jgi:hypothetical protein
MDETKDYVTKPRQAAAAEMKVYEPSILFTADDLCTIKNYVRSTFLLKTTHYDIAHELGLTRMSLTVSVLEGMSSLNSGMIEHARTWPELESRTSQLGIQLEVFSRGFVESLDSIGELIRSMSAYKRFSSTVGDIENEALDLAPLPDDDNGAPETIAEFLSDIRVRVGAYTARVEAVYELSKTFTRTLETQLIPQARRVSEDFSNNWVFDGGESYESLIRELDAEILEKTQRSKQLTSYTWQGLFAGPLGLAAMYLLVRPSASAVDQELENLIERRETARRDLSRLSPAKALHLKNKLGLEQLCARLELTVQAAQNLQKYWATVDAQVAASYEEALRIDSARRLRLFNNSLNIMGEAWRLTLNQSAALNEVFEEFNSVYAHQSLKGEVL